MKRRKEPTWGEFCRQNKTWMRMAIVALIVCAVMFFAQSSYPASISVSRPLVSPDWDTVLVSWEWDGLGVYTGTEDTIISVPDTLVLGLNEFRDWYIHYRWVSGGDTSSSWDRFLYARGPADTTNLPFPLESPDYDTVILVSEYESSDTMVFWDSLVADISSGLVDTFVQTPTDKDWYFTMSWISAGDTAQSTEEVFYATVTAPEPATGNFVTCYYDGIGGNVESGVAVPRSDIEYTLLLQGEQSLYYSPYGIVPKRQTARPSGTGRVEFDVIPTTLMSPGGAYYVLTYSGRSGRYFVSGKEIERFYVDTIPDPLNIIEAEKAW